MFVSAFATRHGREAAMAVALAAGAAVACIVGLVQLPTWGELFGLGFALSTFLLICVAEARQ